MYNNYILIILGELRSLHIFNSPVAPLDSVHNFKSITADRVHQTRNKHRQSPNELNFYAVVPTNQIPKKKQRTVIVKCNIFVVIVIVIQGIIIYNIRLEFLHVSWVFIL